MLRDNLYKIQSLSNEENIIHATIILNESHEIFSGHFPGNPVMPGVCEMQVVKELVTLVIEQPLKLVEADDIKFLQMINPQHDKTLQAEIHYSINDTEVNVRSIISQKEKICFKMKAVFILQ